MDQLEFRFYLNVSIIGGTLTTNNEWLDNVLT